MIWFVLKRGIVVINEYIILRSVFFILIDLNEIVILEIMLRNLVGVWIYFGISFISISFI